MVEHQERRQDQREFMQAIVDQNKLLSAQNDLLVQICNFITPVSAFFAALKNFVIFMAWIVGAITACIAAYHGFIAWVKAH